MNENIVGKTQGCFLQVHVVIKLSTQSVISVLALVKTNLSVIQNTWHCSVALKHKLFSVVFHKCVTIGKNSYHCVVL